MTTETYGSRPSKPSAAASTYMRWQRSIGSAVLARQRSSTARRTSREGGSARISATARSLEVRSTVATRSSLPAKW